MYASGTPWDQSSTVSPSGQRVRRRRSRRSLSWASGISIRNAVRSSDIVVALAAGYDRAVPDRLYFTDSDDANALIASDPMALLVGFELDQQVTVQKAFTGPLALRERLGAVDAATLASADLEPVFFAKPVIHRYPRSMAKRVHELAVHVRDRYAGDAARVWTDASDSVELRANLRELPGFGEMKIKT